MNKIKKEKGITLVALIITIVVLLILAVVAIGAVKDSNIIGYAQNAAGSYNQAKANEVDALTKYEQEIEKYVPGEKQEYIGNLRLNTKYMAVGKDTDNYVIFYSNGKAEFGGIEIDYIIEDNILKAAGMEINIIKEEKNDILTIESTEGNIFFATTTEGIRYFNGEKYVCGDKYLILSEDSYGWKMAGQTRTVYTSPAFYNGILYNMNIDIQNDGKTEYVPYTTDNCETFVINGETYTKSEE